jgi:exodeoxyribonuclease VII large subunit
LLGTARQRLDDRGERLRLALPGLLAARRAAFERAVAALPDPRLMVTARRATLSLTAERLRSALRHATARRAEAAARVLHRLSEAPLRARLREATARLEGLAARLEGVSYQKVLERGFVMVADRTGAPLTSAKAVKPGADLSLRFADGTVRATAAGGRGGSRQGALPL